MNNISIDALARETGGSVSRRASLGALSAAALTALLGPLAAGARKKGRKRKDKKDVNKKADQKCQQQNAQCLDFFTPRCNGDQACVEGALRCCRVAGDCNVTDFLFCLEEEA